MFLFRSFRSRRPAFVSSLMFLFALALGSFPIKRANGDEKKSADPWPNSQTLQPTQFLKMLTDEDVTVPTVVFVGFRSL